MNTWNDATFDNRNDIVFEGRNQAYGAYEIRRNYNIRVTYIVVKDIVKVFTDLKIYQFNLITSLEADPNEKK